MAWYWPHTSVNLGVQPLLVRCCFTIGSRLLRADGQEIPGHLGGGCGRHKDVPMSALPADVAETLDLHILPRLPVTIGIRLLLGGGCLPCNALPADVHGTLDLQSLLRHHR